MQEPHKSEVTVSQLEPVSKTTLAGWDIGLPKYISPVYWELKIFIKSNSIPSLMSFANYYLECRSIIAFKNSEFSSDNYKFY